MALKWKGKTGDAILFWNVGAFGGPWTGFGPCTRVARRPMAKRGFCRSSSAQGADLLDAQKRSGVPQTRTFHQRTLNAPVPARCRRCRRPRPDRRYAHRCRRDDNLLVLGPQGASSRS